jgi:hypothetical protein
LDRAVDTVVAGDASEIPLNNLSDAVPMRGIEALKLRDGDFGKIAIHGGLRGAEEVLRDVV